MEKLPPSTPQKFVSQQETKTPLTDSKVAALSNLIFKPPKEVISLKTRIIEQLYSLAKGIEVIEKEFLHLGIEQEETAEDKMFTALNSWVDEALPGENRKEAKKKIEECLYGTSSILNLSGLQLSSLPDIWDYPVFIEKLEKINLSDNTLSKLPDSLNYFQTLNKLILLNSGITTTPHLPNLQETTESQPTIDCTKPEDVSNQSDESIPLTETEKVYKALQENSLDQLTPLLQKGLNVNSRIYGLTPLMLAASLGHKDIVTVLLKYGADSYAKDATGKTAIRYAALYGNEDVVICLKKAMKAKKIPPGFLLEHRLEHKTIINLLKPLYGDRVNENGICHGIAIMGVQAILSGHLDQFNKRLKDLALFLEKHKLSKNQENHTNPYNAIITKIKREKNVDLLAFLEGIQICMEGGKLYPHLFTEEKQIITQLNKDFIKKALSIVGSKEFHDQGELLDIPTFTGVYTKENLIDYFSSLKKTKPQKTIALQLNSRKHAITVGYDPKKICGF